MTGPEPWMWLALAGLGALHGLNPGMGWLFAVALGMHRREARIVWIAPIPLALGHALSVALAAGLFLWAGLSIDPAVVRTVSGLALVGWGFYHWRFGHRHRVRFGMTTGLVGLAAWSFLMATAHGAGLMLWPALMPLCTAAASGTSGPLLAAALGVGLHTLAMLLVTAAVAITVYHWLGLTLLRQAWVNIDLVWTAALVVAGLWLIAM